MDFFKKLGQIFLNIFLQYYIYFWFLVLGLTLLAGYKFFLYPQWKHFQSLQKADIPTLKKEIQNRQNYLGRLKEFLALYEKVNQTELNNLKQMLPEKVDIPSLYILFEKLAKDNNFKLSKISFGNLGMVPEEESKSKLKLSKISITLTFSPQSEKADFFQLLDSIERNFRLLDVTSFSLKGGSDFQLNLVTYYAPPEETN